MQSAQESKQELEAAIRYAENAISSAKRTIESMEFRQEMAKKQSSEQTGREEALTKLVKELEELNEKLAVDNSNLEKEVQRQQDLGQGYYDSMMTFIEEVAELKEFNAELSKQNVSLAEGKPTMPVIPKDVAIAIFREGVAHGVSNACDELAGQRIDIEESEYIGGFEVSFSKIIDLDDELDLDWLRMDVRDKVGDYNEAPIIEALKGLCADNKFECRIHGIDDQETQSND